MQPRSNETSIMLQKCWKHSHFVHCVMILSTISSVKAGTVDYLIVTGADGDNGKIYKAEIPTGPWTDLQILLQDTPNALPKAVDILDGNVYWCDPDKDYFGRHPVIQWDVVTALPAARAQLEPWQSPVGLAVDPIAHLIYYTDDGLRHIAVTDADGSTKAILVPQSSVYVNNPKAIAVDYNAGYMFWVDHPYTIQRAAMTGEDPTTVYTMQGEVIRGLATDMRDKRIYFCEQNTRQIRSCDYNGENFLEEPIQFPVTTNCVDVVADHYNLYAIRSDEQQDASTEFSLIRFSTEDLRYSQRQEIGENFGATVRLFGLTVRNFNQQVIDTTGCSSNNGGCKDAFCVAKPGDGRTCVCPEAGCDEFEGNTNNGNGGNNGNGDGSESSVTTTETNVNNGLGNNSASTINTRGLGVWLGVVVVMWVAVRYLY